MLQGNFVEPKLLTTIAKTNMTKSYKMVALLCFTKNGELVPEVSLSDLVDFFKATYKRDPFYRDLRDEQNKDLCNWPYSKMVKFLIRNPLSHLVDSSDGIFYLGENTFGIDVEFFNELDKNSRTSDFEAVIYRRLLIYFQNKHQYQGPL